MRTTFLISLLLLSSSVTLAVDGKLTKPAEEIQRICFREAGIPDNDPNYTITEDDLDAVVRCAERYIN